MKNNLKRIILLAGILLPVLMYGQPASYTLKGKAGLLNTPAKVYLVYNLGNHRITDSVTPVNGVFEFSGMIEQPVRSMLIVSHDGRNWLNMIHRDALPLYLEKGVMVLSPADSISNASVVGSELNANYKKLWERLGPVMQKASDLHREHPGANDSLLIQEKNTIILEYIKNYPQTIVSLDVLMEYERTAPDVKQVMALFNSLSPVVRETEAGKAYSAYLISATKTAIGTIAPDFSQPDTSGKIVRLSSFRGHYVFLDFWASWCGPCRAENPNLVKTYAKYHSKGLEIVGVSLDQPNDKTKWLSAIHSDGLTWTQLSDLKFLENEAAILYGVKSIPHNFLIDPAGKIIATDLRDNELDKAIQKLAL